MTSIPKRPLRGILKPSKSSPLSESSSPPPETGDDDEAARQIALKHATIYQERKDLEHTILQSIIRLTDLPTIRSDPTTTTTTTTSAATAATAATAANPSPADVDEFKRLVRVFQPTDYDDLIEERNTCGLCGYALCPEPRKVFAGTGAWKLVGAGTRDFSIVQKKDLERWCSAGCARRALYIKVQLNETAAWERVGIPDIEIELLDEEHKGETEEEELVRRAAKLMLETDRKTAQQTAVLAIERGDPDTKLRVDGFDIEIKEKAVTSQPSEPKLRDVDDDSHVLLEGHRPKFAS